MRFVGRPLDRDHGIYRERFETPVATIKEGPQGDAAGLQAALGPKPLQKLGDSQISPALRGMAHPHDRRGVVVSKAPGGTPRREARQAGVNHSITQILTVGSGHGALHH
jgi:hypothetical protein